MKNIFLNFAPFGQPYEGYLKTSSLRSALR